MRWRRLIALVRTGLGGRLWILAVVVAAIGLIIAHYAFPSGRFFVVEARTLAATVTVVGHRQSWRLPDAVLCVARPLDAETLPDAPDDGGLCDPVRYTEHEAQTLEPILPDGGRLRVALRPDGVLEIAPVGDTELAATPSVTLDRRSFILVPGSAWRATGVLSFAGMLQIGDDVAPGSRHYLLEGRYEVRGDVLAYRVAAWFGAATRPITLTTGELIGGDRVELTSAGRASPASAVVRPPMQGFVTPPADADAEGVRIVAVSAPDRAELRVASFASTPRRVDAAWTDAAVRDPLVLALTALLTVCALVVTIIVDVLQLGRTSPPPRPKGDRAAIRRRRRRWATSSRR